MSKKFSLFLVFSIVLVLIAGCNTFPGNKPAILDQENITSVIIPTSSGPVEGQATNQGQVFLGIPYAAAPVGVFRWRAPQPVPARTQTRQAFKTGSPCVQAIGLKAATGGGGGLVMGSEDCLFLNIYTPAVARKPASGWPVVVYIPGGAFALGSGDNYDPSPLVISQQVIVVTINYRLGAFGFLAHPGLVEESPAGGSGNFALLDQQAALRWVKDNISAAGGNRENVTLMGESAGAWSACYHLVSPASAGLFVRAILQSGSCMEKMSMAEAGEADKTGPDYAAQAGCGENSARSALACLRSLSARQIARLPSYRKGINGAGSWGPVWGDAVIPFDPARAFAEGSWNVMPTIIGSNFSEGRLFALGVRDEAAYIARLQTEYGQAADAVLARYPISNYEHSSMKAYAAVMTDSRFACPADELRRILSSRGKVYGYEFADPNPPITISNVLSGGPMGPYHASELGFVFGSSWALEDIKNFNPQQRQLSSRMMQAWGNFFRTGVPSLEWKNFIASDLSLQHWSSQRMSNIESFTKQHQCDFWLNIQ